MNMIPRSASRKIDSGFQEGFTLIELLVVIAIIALLIAILLPRYNDAQKRPYDVAALQCGRAIVTAETTYRIANGTYGAFAALGTDVSEACTNIQVNTHASGGSASTTGDQNVGASQNNFAFSVFSKNGSGYYQYWADAPDAVANGQRLNKLVSF